MMVFILGKKNSQSQTFNEKGERVPVTSIITSPCYLIDIKTPQRNGYFALKLGFGETKKIKKPVQGELTKAGIKTPLRFLKEFRLDKYKGVELIEEEGKRGIKIKDLKIFVGQQLKASDLFKKGEKVIVSGISKGKGFQGVVRRYGFSGGPRTHGQSDRERAPGSVGQTTTPGRIFKGKRMAGRMGGERVTIKNLPIVEVKENELIVKGLVPGAKEGLLEIKAAIEK
ncbi:MAG: 50S ribosomal protein L3 [Microgenomates group bacterium]